MKAAEPLRALSSTFAERRITVIGPSTRSDNCKGAPARDVVEVAVRSILDAVLERAGLVRAFLTQTADPSLAADLRGVHEGAAGGGDVAARLRVPRATADERDPRGLAGSRADQDHRRIEVTGGAPHSLSSRSPAAPAP